MGFDCNASGTGLAWKQGMSLPARSSLVRSVGPPAAGRPAAGPPEADEDVIFKYEENPDDSCGDEGYREKSVVAQEVELASPPWLPSDKHDRGKNCRRRAQ